MRLLYRTAEWHALAKARMHTETSLALLETLTTEFGRLLREFRDLTCTQFSTTELPREAAARYRRQTQRDTTGTSAASTSQPKSRKSKSLNLSTIKLHALGDYVRQIFLFGTTDSYSTQLVRSLLKQGV